MVPLTEYELIPYTYGITNNVYVKHHWCIDNELFPALAICYVDNVVLLQSQETILLIYWNDRSDLRFSKSQ